MRRFLGVLAIVLATAGAAAPATADDPDIMMSQFYLMSGDVEHARESINAVSRMVHKSSRLARKPPSTTPRDSPIAP